MKIDMRKQKKYTATVTQYADRERHVADSGRYMNKTIHKQKQTQQKKEIDVRKHKK